MIDKIAVYLYGKVELDQVKDQEDEWECAVMAKASFFKRLLSLSPSRLTVSRRIAKRDHQ